MTNQAQKAQVTFTPSGLAIPAYFTAHQANRILAIDTEATALAAQIERDWPTPTVLRARADEYKRTGQPHGLILQNREHADQLDKGARYFAVCQLIKMARGGGEGTRAYFLSEYLKLVAAKAEAEAERAAQARHVFFGTQFDPSDDTWAAIKVYRDGNPIVLDEGFATEEEADECAELARQADLAASNKPARVVAATAFKQDQGEFVVCVGDALGPVIGRFPRTEEGHRAAVELAEAE